MRFILLIVLILAGCSKEKTSSKADNVSDGEIEKVISERNLTENDVIGAVKTFNPTGAPDEYLAFYGTGVSGRLVVMGMPSMKILKYVSVFSAEPWQGYAFDDESKAILKASSRDEIEYSFGTTATPALSLTKGQHDGRAVFMADASNGRLALIDLAEYETKQIVVNELFKNSHPSVSVSSETKYIAQVTKAPEYLNQSDKLSSGVTFWHFLSKKNDWSDHEILFIDPNTSFTILFPSSVSTAPVFGRNNSEGYLYFISNCVESFKDTQCESNQSYLYIVDWKKAEDYINKSGTKIKNSYVVDYEAALKNKLVTRFRLPTISEKVSIASSGEYGAITSKASNEVILFNLQKNNSTTEGELIIEKSIAVGGNSVDATFSKKHLFVTIANPGKLLKIDLENKSIIDSLDLNFVGGKIYIPGSDSKVTSDKYAILMNKNTMGRFTEVGPTKGLGARLIDIESDKLRVLYDASIPMATDLGVVAMEAKVNKAIYKYKIGTDPRTGYMSNYKTTGGSERIIREGKRVHVYATLIRSHVTPDLIEVEQGDIVSIHLTSNEQSKDQTHGFTIDTYNVHGSFEPGKTASVTFVADRVGVFPLYCTEFCSALHLEMQGYFLVKPSTSKHETSDILFKLHNDPQMNSFFKYVRGE